MNGVDRFGVVGLRTAYSGGRLTPKAAVAGYFERIEQYDAVLNCFTALDRDRAFADARLSAERIAADEMRALEAVPIAVKANIAVAGQVTTAGTAALAGNVASEDAEIVRRLRDAGAIVLGIVNMHEAALGATTDNPHFGATQNPHRPGHTPGGSSGGSGAAVAAGLCAAALGTDTLGSVRLPAAYNGVFGLKPTNGLVPNDGLVPLSRRLDVIGPLARSLSDLAAIMEVMAPLEPAGTVSKIATLDIVRRGETESDVRRSYLLAADLLAGSGFVIQDYDTGDLDLKRARMAGFVESARAAKVYFDSRPDADPSGLSEDLRRLFDFAAGFDAAAVTAGDRLLDDTARLLRSILADADAILLPTAPQAAFRHGDSVPVTQADYTALANIAGLPAISVPAGLTADGLPVGVQLIGRAGGERTLIALAARLDGVLKGYVMPTGYD